MAADGVQAVGDRPASPVALRAVLAATTLAERRDHTADHRGRCRGGRAHEVVRESGGGFAAEPDPVDGLELAVGRLVGRSPDELDDAEVERELSAIEQVSRRLQARTSKLAAVLAQRRAKRAVEADQARGGSGDAGRLAQQAVREVRRELVQQLDWSPSQAKRAVELGRRLNVETSPEARAAFDQGELSEKHAQLLADTLRWFDEVDERAEVEAELLAAATHQHPVEFGRTCRRLLAERDHAAATTAEQRRKARRSVRLWQTEDGFQAVSGQLPGLDGEYVATGIQAFRRPDAPGERRTPQQATADALVAMAAAALKAGEAPTVRGVRPHVTVELNYPTILANAGVAETRWSGPLPYSEIRRLLADCDVSRLLTDAEQVPVEAGRAVRSVPAGVARGVARRDPVCIADGCDLPADWCQVMHLDVPYALGGRLTIDTAAHGCDYHHDRLDRHGWVITWIDTTPILHHPDRIPDAVRRADPTTIHRGRRRPSAQGRQRNEANEKPVTTSDGVDATSRVTPETTQRDGHAGRDPEARRDRGCEQPSLLEPDGRQIRGQADEEGTSGPDPPGP
jgi:hypothetical protein